MALIKVSELSSTSSVKIDDILLVSTTSGSGYTSNHISIGDLLSSQPFIDLSSSATSGSSGTSGLDGTSGTSGSDGTSGTSGNSGSSGTSGTSGSDGSSGTSGLDGSSGTSGLDGTSGSSGTSGSDGYTPVFGVDYFNGENGTNGLDGYTPILGLDYFNGENGYTPVFGVDYFNGADGTNGIDGTSGVDGYTPQFGIDYFNGTDGSSGTSGIDGSSGTSGSSGTTGSSGTSGIVAGEIYYFNQSVPSGIGTYRDLNREPSSASQTGMTLNVIKQTTGITVSTFITPELGFSIIPGGTQRFHLHFLKPAVNDKLFAQVSIRLCNSLGTPIGPEIISTPSYIGWTDAVTSSEVETDIVLPTTTIDPTNRMLVKVMVDNEDSTNHNVTWFTEGNTAYSFVMTSVGTRSGSSGTSGTSGTSPSLVGYAITGSNVFNGNQTITGSLNVSGSINITNGSVTMPQRPAFRVTGAGGGTAATTVLSGSMTNIDYNQGNAWNNSNGTFTAPIAGLYQVNLVARCSGNSNPSAQVIVYKNNTTTSPSSDGTAQVMLEWAANTTANHIGGSTITKLAVGDTLKTIVTVGTISFDGNDNFSVAYIG